jgi:hypothetical protein
LAGIYHNRIDISEPNLGNKLLILWTPILNLHF